MSGETIPLTFEAVNNLSADVKLMVASLQQLVDTQGDAAKAAKETETAQEGQASSTSHLADVTIIATGAAELAGKAWEAGKFAYEALAATLTASLEAWDEQSKKTGQSASALGSVAEASAKTDKAQTKMLASLGMVIEKTGVLQLANLAQQRVLDGLNKLLKDNQDRIAAVSQELTARLLTSLKEANEWFEKNAETLARFVQFLTACKDTLAFVGNAIDILVQTIKTSLYGALYTATSLLSGLLDQMVAFIKYAGGEVPQALEDLRLGMEQTAKDARVGLGGALDGLIKSTDDGAAQLEKIGQSLVDTFGEPTAKMKETEAAIKSATKVAAAEIAKLEADLATARTGKTKARGDLVADPDKAAERAAAISLDYENRINAARAAGNELYAIQLERRKGVYERDLAIAALKTEELKYQTRLNADAAIEVNEREKLLALDEQSKQNARELYELNEAFAAEERARDEAEDVRLRERYERIKALEAERKAAMLETINTASAAYTEGFAGAGSLLTESLNQDLAAMQARIDGNAEYMTQLESLGQLDDTTKARMIEQNAQLADEMDRQARAAERQIAALERSAEAVAVLGSSISKVVLLNKSFKDSADEVTAAMGAGVNLASALVGAFEEDVKKRAAWEAAFNAAAGVAATAFALAGYPGYAGAAIGHFAAAAKFGLVATGVIGAGGGGGGGAGGGVSTGSGQTTTAIATVDMDRERQLTAASIAEAVHGEGRASSASVNINFGNSMIISETPNAARIITDLITPELTRIIGNGG